MAKRKRSSGSGTDGEGGAKGKGKVGVSAAVAKTQRRDYMREKRAEEAQQVSGLAACRIPTRGGTPPRRYCTPKSMADWGDDD